jgi:hypothetical protein
MFTVKQVQDQQFRPRQSENHSFFWRTNVHQTSRWQAFYQQNCFQDHVIGERRTNAELAERSL